MLDMILHHILTCYCYWHAILSSLLITFLNIAVIPPWQTGYLSLIAVMLVTRTYCDVWMIQNGTMIERLVVSLRWRRWQRRFGEEGFCLGLMCFDPRNKPVTYISFSIVWFCVIWSISFVCVSVCVCVRACGQRDCEGQTVSLAFVLVLWFSTAVSLTEIADCSSSTIIPTLLSSLW